MNDDGPAGPARAEGAVLVRHDPPGMRTALAGLFVSIVSFAAPLTAAPGWLAVASAIAVMFTAGVCVRLSRGTRIATGEDVTADGGGVHVGGALVLARSSIAYGFVEPSGQGATVKLHDAGHGLRLEVRVRDVAQGQELLRALGLDLGQRVTPFFAASSAGGLRAGVLALASVAGVWFLLGMLPRSGQSIAFDDAMTLTRMFLPLAMLLAWATLSSVPTRVTVGADGLHVRWLRRERFVPYRSIVRLVPAFGMLRVVLADGTTLHLRGQRRSFSPQTRPDHRAMVDRVEAAIAEHLARSRVQEAIAQLPSPRDDAAGWVRELEAVQVGVEGSYRRARVSDEALWRVVQDPSVDERVRAGAAVALRKVLDAAGRNRLRVVAESSASPRLRVALEAASGAEDHAVERSLDELCVGEDARGQPRRRARG